MTGKVYLVGAGPGDPDLLTLKAADLLRTADVVLHDDLVSKQIVNLAPPRAQVRNVGKRCGKKKISQEEIHFLLVEFASLGLKVVRLKSGDPLLFGRLGEEILALRKAGIDFEIVPGVTSAFGAAAFSQFPFTYRHASSVVIFLTGHRADGAPDIDWQTFVASRVTLVIYMPGHNYSSVAARLRAAGAEADTPCAIVSQATLANQQTFVTTLAALPDAPRLPAPTLLIIGEVVRFAGQFEPPLEHLPALPLPHPTAGQEPNA